MRTLMLLLTLSLLSACGPTAFERALGSDRLPPIEEWSGFISQWGDGEIKDVVFVHNYEGVDDGFCVAAPEGERKMSLIASLSRSQGRLIRRSFNRYRPYERRRLFEVRVTGWRLSKRSEYFYPNAHIGVPYDEIVELSGPLEFTGRSCRLFGSLPQDS